MLDVHPVAVVGNSMGGTIAALLAHRHPERVRQLAVVCASPQWGRAARSGLARAFAGIGGRGAMELFQLSVRWGAARYVEPLARMELDDMLRRADRPTMLDLYRRLAVTDLKEVLPGLRLPALVLGGDRDRLAPPFHLRVMAAALPNSKLVVVPGAGHFLCITHSTEMTGILSRFLDNPEAVPGDQGHSDAG